ncbi:putative disease resistance RPP13-like protein 3 isoform X1 [Panicum hallii]|uniref:putative disease resistance RPP13-like protein 3 isoform X1 n=1 Tax=Panicum hallii TaxID=206008 RepID=UPI000DF4CD81|nr:putative disease resistance RPP13-like protein 3 isoform X1 [Panicum hallii]
MAEAVIGPLLGRIQQLVVSEGRKLAAVSEDIQSLRDKLILIQAFLWDADLRRRAMSDEFTRAWVQQIRDAVFDAQDSIDQYFFRVDLSRHVLTREDKKHGSVLEETCFGWSRAPAGTEHGSFLYRWPREISSMPRARACSCL